MALQALGGVHSALADGTPLLVELEELRPRLHGASAPRGNATGDQTTDDTTGPRKREL